MIHVAGMNRTGTTLVWRALARIDPGDTLDRNLNDKLHSKGILTKHHNLDDRNVNNGDKVIFMFGDPVMSAISAFIRNSNETNERIFKEDFRGWEKMFDFWTVYSGYDVICLRYDTLYDNLEHLFEFLGKRYEFPPWKKRRSNYNKVTPKQLDRAKKTYARLSKKIEEAADVYVFKFVEGEEHE